MDEPLAELSVSIRDVPVVLRGSGLRYPVTLLAVVPLREGFDVLLTAAPPREFCVVTTHDAVGGPRHLPPGPKVAAARIGDIEFEYIHGTNESGSGGVTSSANYLRPALPPGADVMTLWITLDDR